MSLVRRILDSLHLGGTPRLMALSGAVGIGAGVGAVLLIKAIAAVDWAARQLRGTVSLGRAGVFVVLPLGIWIAWRVTAWFAPEVAGHGVPQIIAAIAVRGGHVRARVMPLKTAATALTIGTGGSAGREGSIAQIGSSIGSWVARRAQLSENDIRVLVAAGAGAGISATFNAPIAGMFFAMEVILREFSSRHVHTIVVASVAGAVVSRSLIGEDLIFSVPAYRLDDPRQLLLYGALGLVTVAAAWFFLVSLDWFEVVPGRLPAWFRPLLLAAMVATLGVVRPEILGAGQDFVGEILRGGVEFAWWTFGLLAVLKALATAATLGGRGSGGIFMPSLFIGATTGFGFALLVDPIWNVSAINPGAFALVGMAATFAGVARAPLTSMLIVFEITGDYGLVLPLMVAAAISTILAGRVRPLSAYAAPLARMGIHPVSGAVTDLLDTVRVEDVARPDFVAVTPADTLATVQGMMHKYRLQGLPVAVGERLVGVVSLGDVTAGGGASDDVTAGEVMTPDPITVTLRTPVSEALERMAALGVGRLPVVDERDSTRLIAMFGRKDVVAAYHRALGDTVRARTRPDRFEARTDPGTRFFELEITSGSPADGKSISEITWPEGCVVVSVYRGSTLLVPNGRTVIQAGDSITAFGGDRARELVVEHLAPPPDGFRAGTTP